MFWLRLDWSPALAIGMRPLDIWNDTAAAPTFWMLGPATTPLIVIPWPFMPWQDAQFVVKIA